MSRLLSSCLLTASQYVVATARVLLIFVFLLSIANPCISAAQVLGPNPIIGGVPVVCGGIPTVVQANIGDIARAIPGWIVLDPKVFYLPDVVQIFIYAHECSHHVLGSNEAAADCLAIRTGRDQGWFLQNDIAWLVRYFGNSPGDWTHAPGPYRINSMVSCFSAP